MAIKLKKVKTVDGLARLLGYPSYNQLRSVVYGGEAAYRDFEIPKRGGGTRYILAPEPRLMTIQKRLAESLEEIYSPPKPVHGFVSKRSITTNADAHVGAGVVLNLDLENFFPSITFSQVLKVLREPPYRLPESVAVVVAQICCHEKVLPQGAPTSPIISNMVCLALDRELTLLAKRCWCTYTRYADDLTFSSPNGIDAFPIELANVADGEVQVGSELAGSIKRHGFRINQRKVRIADASARMEVTGLTVNVRRNVRRRYVRQIDAMLHAWETFGFEAAQLEFDQKYDRTNSGSGTTKEFDRVVAGKLAFLLAVRGIDDPVYSRLARRFNDLVGSDVLQLPLPATTLFEEPDKIVFRTGLESYRYVKQLGAGGCGTVVSVVDEAGATFAIKFLSPGTTGRVKRKRFRNEMAFCYRTRHPRIVRALAHGVVDVEGEQLSFYVMPRYKESLAEVMQRGVDPEDVVPLFLKIVEAVQAVHELDVVHRDLKPHNILLDEAGDLVVADFGIADFDPSLMETVVRTARGERVANWGYAAPEQRERGHLVGKPADIFALGMMLSEMFTGRLPFGQEPVLIEDVAPDYALLDPLVLRMLRQAPEERPTLEEVWEALQAFVADDSGESALCG